MTTPFEGKIHYEFKNQELLEKALTHSSYTKEHGKSRASNNERLEFLGDAFLDAVIGQRLYELLPDTEEGTLTKDRALIVCEDSLAEVGKNLGIGEYLKLSKGEEHMGGREKPSITADAVEAVIGAVFLDSGYERTGELILELFDDIIKRAVAGKICKDHKSRIQEIVQARGPAQIEYVLEREEGPDHDKTFFVKIIIDGTEKGRGTGKSKKDAEQNAAKEAVERETKIVL